jgi:hypothetical protein
MAFDLSGLNPFIQEQQFPLLTKALAGGRTAELMRKQVGVKGPTTVNLMDVDVNMAQAPVTSGNCGFSASGDVVFTQQTIDAKHVKINMEVCPKKLENFYLSTQLAPGAIQDSMPFEELFSNYLVEKIQDEIEKIIWQGDGSGTSGTNLDMFDGILQQTAGFTDCNTAAYNGGTLSSPLTVADMVEAIKRVYALTPSAAVEQNDFKIFVGLDKFRLAAAGLLDGSGLTSTGGQLANYASDFDPFRLVYPGTNIEVIGVNGLTGLNGVYGASLNNLVLGLDLDTDTSDAGLEVWYSKDNRTIRVACEFIMGTQVAFPDQVGKVAV